MAWVHGVLAVLCLAIGGLHLVRLVRMRHGRALEAAYAGMALGMAGMFAPAGDPVPAPLWIALFLLGGGWFGGLLLHARSIGALGGEARHLLVGSAAMLFMLGADHDTGAVDGRHAAPAAGAPGTAGLASAVALAFAAYFVLHTLRCADRLRATPGGERAGRPVLAAADPGPAAAIATVVRSPAPTPCSTSVSATAHLVMTAAMAIMLVGLI
jgi:hypothetical protein